MKKGYIVWNQTTHDEGFEFFGVYRTREQANKRLREVVKKRFGKLPKDWNEFVEWEGDEDSYRIDEFNSEAEI